MIPLKRDRTENAVHQNFRGKEPIDRLIEVMKQKRDLLKSNSDKKLKFSSSKWKVTKKQLQQETGGKCAYCEATTTESMHGDVEHYRPKSHYWWLAYVYDNYLASCQLCNQKFKKAFFELINPQNQMQEPAFTANTSDAEIEQMAKEAIPDPLDSAGVAAFDKAHGDERPKILNPYVDDPADYFAWEVKGVRVDLVPNDANPDAADVVDACERLLGLNRPDLRDRRFGRFTIYKTIASIVDNEQVPETLRQQARDQISNSFLAANQPYAGMIRYFENQRKAGAPL